MTEEKSKCSAAMLTTLFAAIKRGRRMRTNTESYDFVQWGLNHDDDPKVHGFLFNDDTGTFGHGAFVGACAFRWREYRDYPSCWAMQWVWIAPKVRRQSILSRRWGAFRARFGKFVIEPPLSEAMQAFAAKKHGVVDLVMQ